MTSKTARSAPPIPATKASPKKAPPKAQAKSATELPLESAALPAARRTNPIAFTQQVIALDIGETACRANRLPAATTVHADIIAAKGKLRDTIGGQIAKVKAKPECTGRTFTTSIGHFSADDGDTLVVLTVTRLS
jgi:hypothetical protein